MNKSQIRIAILAALMIVLSGCVLMRLKASQRLGEPGLKLGRVEGVDSEWRWLPQQFDASILSDECLAPGQAHFTGAFVGMACQDLAGTGKPADFDYFAYEERPFRANLPSAAPE